MEPGVSLLGRQSHLLPLTGDQRGWLSGLRPGFSVCDPGGGNSVLFSDSMLYCRATMGSGRMEAEAKAW